MSIIIDTKSQKLIPLTLFYIEDVNTNGVSIFSFIRSKDELAEWEAKGYVKEDSIAVGDPKPDKVILILNTFWKQLTWKDSNKLLSQSISNVTQPGGEVSMRIDAIKFRELKLKSALKHWSLTDENGQSVGISDSIIDNLNPAFANELLSSFEIIMGETNE